jgi:SAM-dependent methyltransferase
VTRERKWWLDSVEDQATDAHSLQRLAQVNARGAVPVEIAAGHHAHGDARDGKRKGDERPASDAPPVNQRFLKEAHHRQYGRPWGMGRYLFDFVVDSGVRREHRLLDFGCGALRLGIWVIPYLEAGNYFGVDSHLVSLEAAVTYEIPLHRLEQKRPRLLWNDDFAFSHFEQTFDVIVDVSSSSRVKEPDRLRRAFASFAAVLKPGGRLLTVPVPDVPTDELAAMGLELVRGEVMQRCELMEGHEDSFRPYNVWNELVRK